MSSSVPPNCRTCGHPINDPSHIIWNGHHYHNDHVPAAEPPPSFDVVQLQPDEDTPGLWIGFQSEADRAAAMRWFRVVDEQSPP